MCSVLMLRAHAHAHVRHPERQTRPNGTHSHAQSRSCMLAATTAGPTKRATVRTLRRKKSCRSITRCSVQGSSSSRPLKRSQLSTSTGLFSCLEPRRMARSRSVVRSCGLSNSGDPKAGSNPPQRNAPAGVTGSAACDAHWLMAPAHPTPLRHACCASPASAPPCQGRTYSSHAASRRA